MGSRTYVEFDTTSAVLITQAAVTVEGYSPSIEHPSPEPDRPKVSRLARRIIVVTSVRIEVPIPVSPTSILVMNLRRK